MSLLLVTDDESEFTIYLIITISTIIITVQLNYMFEILSSQTIIIIAISLLVIRFNNKFNG